MQPNYPLRQEEKILLRRKAKEKIVKIFRQAKATIITHFHYDHYLKPDDPEIPDKSIFRKKIHYYIKNPNIFINENQRRRAEKFLDELLKLNNKRLKEYYIQPDEKLVKDRTEELLANYSIKRKNTGSRREKRNLEWIKSLAKKWASNKWIKNNIITKGPKIVFSDNSNIEVCGFRLEFTEPLFHGGELEKTGWVLAIKIKFNNKTMFYTSDLMGPVIEDYAYKIIENKPNMIILDGPPFYLPPYMFPKKYIQRAIDNIEKILDSLPDIILLDHHPLRTRNWKKKLEKVFKKAEKENISIYTYAEVLGRQNLIDTI